MSRDSILKVMETENEAQRIVEDARLRARKMTEEAEQKGEALCLATEQETAKELGATLAQIREKTEQMTARVLEEANAEAEEIRKKAKLSKKVAEKIIIRGLDSKCR